MKRYSIRAISIYFLPQRTQGTQRKEKKISCEWANARHMGSEQLQESNHFRFLLCVLCVLCGESIFHLNIRDALHRYLQPRLS